MSEFKSLAALKRLNSLTDCEKEIQAALVEIAQKAKSKIREISVVSSGSSGDEEVSLYATYLAYDGADEIDQRGSFPHFLNTIFTGMPEDEPGGPEKWVCVETKEIPMTAAEAQAYWAALSPEEREAEGSPEGLVNTVEVFNMGLLPTQDVVTRLVAHMQDLSVTQARMQVAYDQKDAAEVGRKMSELQKVFNELPATAKAQFIKTNSESGPGLTEPA